MKDIMASQARYIARLEKVAEAAKSLHAAVGDGDNGPARHFNEPWYELDAALKDLELEWLVWDRDTKSAVIGRTGPKPNRTRVLFAVVRLIEAVTRDAGRPPDGVRMFQATRQRLIREISREAKYQSSSSKTAGRLKVMDVLIVGTQDIRHRWLGEAVLDGKVVKEVGLFSLDEEPCDPPADDQEKD